MYICKHTYIHIYINTHTCTVKIYLNLQMQSIKLFWPYYLQNTEYLNVLPNSRWLASAPAMRFFIKGDDNWDRATWILLSTVYIQEPHPSTFLQRTLDVHVDFDELQPALPALKSLGMLQIHQTVCSTYCANQLFERTIATTVFVFSSLQAVTAKHQKLKGLSFSISEDSRFHSDPEEQIWAHKKISNFRLPHLGAWPLARKRNKSVHFSCSAGQQRLMTMPTFRM